MSSIKDKDSKVKKLLLKIDKLEQTIKKLRSENKMLESAWAKTEGYLISISKDKTIKEIFTEIESKTKINKIRKECPNSDCSNKIMNKRQFDGFYLIYCEKCGYRNRIDEEGNS